MLDIKEIQRNSEIIDINKILNRADIIFADDKTSVVDLEKFQDKRRRMRGNYNTTSIKAIAQFVGSSIDKNSLDIDNPTCFIGEDGEAEVVLNFGNTEVPLHQDFTASISLKKTAVFNALSDIKDTRLRQRELAEFIEDFHPHITAYTASYDEIDLSTAINAIRDITIESSRKSQKTEEEYRDTSSAFTSVEAKFKDATPVFLKFNIPVFNEIDNKEFIFRISVITANDEIALSIRCAHWDQVLEEINLEFQNKLDNVLSPLGVRTFIGNWK